MFSAQNPATRSFLCIFFIRLMEKGMVFNLLCGSLMLPFKGDEVFRSITCLSLRFEGAPLLLACLHPSGCARASSHAGTRARSGPALASDPMPGDTLASDPMPHARPPRFGHTLMLAPAPVPVRTSILPTSLLALAPHRPHARPRWANLKDERWTNLNRKP